jgi:hypothetical protein
LRSRLERRPPIFWPGFTNEDPAKISANLAVFEQITARTWTFE